MESPEQIKARAEAALPGVKIDIVPNGSPSRQLSLLIDNEHALAVARFLRDDLALRLDGHLDLRRILMWDEFVDHPMRKDYREADDYEYEPTPHDDVLERAKQHYAPRPQLDGAEKITATDLHG